MRQIESVDLLSFFFSLLHHRGNYNQCTSLTQYHKLSLLIVFIILINHCQICCLHLSLISLEHFQSNELTLKACCVCVQDLANETCCEVYPRHKSTITIESGLVINIFSLLLHFRFSMYVTKVCHML